jgi:hypothetical protein
VHEDEGGARALCSYFAFLQIKTIASLLIRQYEFEYADPSWKPRVDFSQIVATPPPCPLKIKRRDAVIAGPIA